MCVFVCHDMCTPYTVQHLPNTGQILLTLVAWGVQTVRHRPPREKKTVARVWRIR